MIMSHHTGNQTSQFPSGSHQTLEVSNHTNTHRRILPLVRPQTPHTAFHPFHHPHHRSPRDGPSITLSERTPHLASDTLRRGRDRRQRINVTGDALHNRPRLVRAVGQGLCADLLVACACDDGGISDDGSEMDDGDGAECRQS